MKALIGLAAVAAISCVGWAATWWRSRKKDYEIERLNQKLHDEKQLLQNVIEFLLDEIELLVEEKDRLAERKEQQSRQIKELVKEVVSQIDALHINKQIIEWKNHKIEELQETLLQEKEHLRTAQEVIHKLEAELESLRLNPFQSPLPSAEQDKGDIETDEELD